MSSENRDDLRALLGQEVRAVQGAVDLVDQAIAGLLGVNRTDLRCLDALLMWGSGTPSRLGTELGLTTGSVTAMLDRLERQGYLTRSPDPSDRRKVIVTPTPELADMARAAMQPLMDDSAREIAHYTVDELQLLLDFHRLNRRLQERHVQRLRSLPRAARGGR